MSNGFAMQARVDDAEALRLFDAVKRKSGNLEEPLNEIGAMVHRSIIRNFEVGGRYGKVGDWRGGEKKWEPLKASTWLSRNSKFRAFKETSGGVFEQRKKTKDAILINTARLRNSISWQTASNEVVWGTNLVYAAIQHLGGKTKPHVIVPRRKKALAWPTAAWPVGKVNHPGSKIPARPYLLIQDEDLKEAKVILLSHLSR